MTGTSAPLLPSPTEPRRLLGAWARRPPRSHRHTGEALIGAVEAAGLRGRGGAGFPTARKLRTVAAGRDPVVVANGCEGERLSGKDRVLLCAAPQLVIEGIELAAGAVGAREAAICVHPGGPQASSLGAALAARPAGGVRIDLVEVPARYVASEESALVNLINTGKALPTAKPPRPFERGVRGRPTLVDNVETLAHIALIARYGAGWYRGCGTAESPGTALVTLGGALARPGVYEVPFGLTLGQVFDAAGGPREPVQAILTGGYAGTWLPAATAFGLRLGYPEFAAANAALGVGTLTPLPARGCGLTETAQILHYLATESAGQCGPCMFGLPAIAEDFGELVAGGPPARAAAKRLRNRLPVISRRGACGHPDGAVRLANSALRVFEADLAAHVAGRPCRGAGRLLLPARAEGVR
ncbi:NADH-ubiquinone oxidoreductase-F iron-sulfur binding region domain-containing protein [Amycolatopsis alkalitolerans]|uniref:Proton-conducting membrane transporter n=1 Tax=Amycolatopsis alkalitolerans TaxID=2547244 RepID=A0A5C4LZ47_9PSEU|nr:NADH-ubiquinone oxidoreductase-F iron-sulfur binding region domain-containing protein [Amycolatopsis alkalitolerans]TNC22483.1 proton-conducting membrane transporter [Amycolatopsis alkalitolerans]